MKRGAQTDSPCSYARLKGAESQRKKKEVTRREGVVRKEEVHRLEESAHQSCRLGVRKAEGPSDYLGVGLSTESKNNVPTTVLVGKLTYCRRPGRSAILLSDMPTWAFLPRETPVQTKIRALQKTKDSTESTYYSAPKWGDAFPLKPRLAEMTDT